MIESVAESTGITIDAEIDVIDGLLPAEAEINLYRVVQEALNNIVRHSGAGRGAVRIRNDDDSIRLTIVDDGEGFSVRGEGERPARDSFGLSGMEERVRILGGRMKVRSAPGQGTRIFASVPVPLKRGHEHLASTTATARDGGA
jgi:signal transduction histidine kinase